MSTLLDMLDQIELTSTAMLAEKLNSTPEIIEAKLERYEQLGYVQKISMDSSCGNCSSCKGCSHTQKNQAPVVMWEKVKSKKIK